MQFTGAVRLVLRRMEAELPTELHYHNVSHTKDVYRAARRIAAGEKLNDQETRMVLTAAMLHDMGFVLGVEDHEERSCQLAAEILPKYNYLPEEIAEVQRIIMVTKLPQNPKDILEKVMCDADLDYLGRDDYFSISDRLLKEWNQQGRNIRHEEWMEIQVRFLSIHRYFTATSQADREPGKQRNLRLVQGEGA